MDKVYNFNLILRIDMNFVIKVADFGLSESIENNRDYFPSGQVCPHQAAIKVASSREH